MKPILSMTHWRILCFPSLRLWILQGWSSRLQKGYTFTKGPWQGSHWTTSYSCCRETLHFLCLGISRWKEKPPNQYGPWAAWGGRAAFILYSQGRVCVEPESFNQEPSSTFPEKTHAETPIWEVWPRIQTI